MLVLLVDASMHARSSGPETTMNSQTWVDTVLPYIAESTVQGREIAQISAGRLTEAGRRRRAAVAYRHGGGLDVQGSSFRHPTGNARRRRRSWTPAWCPGRTGPPRWRRQFRAC